MLNYRALVSCSFVLLSSFLVQISYATEVVEMLDLTSQTSVSIEPKEQADRYFVVFSARGGSITGHAYVVWGREDSKHKMSTEECYGLYPDKNESKRVILGSVKARLFDGDCRGLNSSIRLIVELSQGLYINSFKVYEQWKERIEATSTEYHILRSNCITFVRAVAESIGLDTPDDQFVFPQAFISGLIQRIRQ